MVDSTGKRLNQQPAYDKLLNTEVQIQVGNDLSKGVVTRQTKGPDGKLIGTYDEDPYKSAMVYEEEFHDGELHKYSASITAENMLTQVDHEPFSTIMFK
jgi:hypothetical protein